ncbi:MAG: hypothetical protein RIC55_19940 [Pirellulaceae bacterium]
MAILVVCSKCKARFQVSEKFAGQKGPCPKCKTVIQVPEKTEEVKIHGPENFGPKTASGKGVLEPIFREETKWSPVAVGVVAGVLVLAFVLALVVRQTSLVERENRKGDMEPVTEVNLLILAAGALLIAPPLAFGAYTVLRDAELEPYRGQDLWIRVGVASLAYPLLWGVLGIIKWMLGDAVTTDDGGVVGIAFVLIVLLAMLATGGGVGHLVFDLEYGSGVVHYGVYLLVCVILRATVGLSIV